MTETRWKLAAVVLASIIVGAAPGAEDEKKPWKQELRGGETVEVIGVSTHPPGPKSWWGPDGQSLDRPPFDGLGSSRFPDEDLKARVFAIRLSGGRVDKSLAVIWDIPKASSTGVRHPPRREGKPAEPGVYGVTASLPRDAAACTIRVGVAKGDWKTEVKGDAETSMGTATELGVIMMAKPRAIPRGTALVVTETISAADFRIVAIDNDGKEHEPAAAESSRIQGVALRELEFALPPDRIREFHFQTRTYQWAEFRDVPLDPRPSRANP